MPQKTNGENFIGDQKSRCSQPPGGASSISFGGSQPESTKPKTNHQASDIFNQDKNFTHHGTGASQGKQSNDASHGQQKETKSAVVDKSQSEGSASIPVTNHEASDILTAHENIEHHGSGILGKRSFVEKQQENTQSKLFGGADGTDAGKPTRKGFNPITGETYESTPPAVETENDAKIIDEAKKDSEDKKAATPVKPAAVSVNQRQPPGGRSTKLW